MDAVSGCDKCALAQTCLTVKIRPAGPDTCDVLVVCDYPSSEEDFSGSSFTGPESKLLHDMIADAGLDQFRIGYTYAVRCKPPLRAKPLPSHIDACREYLRSEIDARRPRIILALGDAALRACTKASGLKTKRGRELSLHLEVCAKQPEIRCYATYSPNFVRRTPHARATVVADIRRVADYLNKRDGEAAPVAWKWWEGETILGEVLAYDIEAVDEDGKYTDYPTQIAITGDNGTFVSRDVQGLAALLVGRRTVGHNSWGYDVDVLRKFGIPVVKDFDTMVLAYYVDETQPLGLEALAVKYLGVAGWKEAFTSKLGSDDFAYYNARDTHYTMQLFELFRAKLGERLKLVTGLILPTRLALDSISERGVWIDASAVQAQKSISEKAVEESLHAIREIVGSGTFNPGSSAQVGAFLVNCGYVLPTTETGKPQTSASVLQSFEGNAFVDELSRYRESKKSLSTYVLPYLSISGTGDRRAHSTYGLVRTKTGRTNSRNPNVQNLTRELKHFYAPAPGNVLISVDYSAVEFRVAAWFARETSILGNFAGNPSWDPHRYFASIFYNITEAEVTKYKRQVAKSANFSQLFLGNENTIREYAKKQGITLSLQECWDIHRAWHKAFPGFYSFYANVREEILETGRVVCPTGHIRNFGDSKLFTRITFGNALREGVNVKVQNLAAHIAFLAMRRLHEEHKPMVLFIHDSISFEYPKDAVTPALIADITNTMENYPIEALKNEFGVTFDMPLKVEVEIKE